MDLNICIVVPSRGRPDSIKALRDAWLETSVGVADLLVCIDDDDPRLEDYLRIDGIDLDVNPRLRLGGTLNLIVPQVARTYWAVGFMGDDHRPRTHGWDQRFKEALLGMQTGVAYGNDLFQQHNLATEVVMTSNIVNALGYFVPPGAVHLYLDNFWMELGRATHLTYLADVIIEHVHPAAGKADWDAQYREVNAPELYSSDEKVFLDYMRETFPNELPKLKALLK